MIRLYILINKLFFILIMPVGIIFLLSSCGGGGSGGDSDSPSQSEELALELGLYGPGDTGGYFPLEVGNLWVFEGIISSTSGPSDYHNTISINKTKNIDGFNTFVLEETNSYGEGSSESYLYKDLNGIANLGSSDEGALGVQLSRYWEVRFPLVSGDSFVQLDRTGLSLGEDLDGDGINDSFDIRSIVTVGDFTSKTVPVGTFDDVVHIRRKMNIDFILSSEPDAISANVQEDSYFAANVGLIERLSSITIDGSTERALEQLAAYVVNGQSTGLNRVAGSVIEGNGDPLGNDIYYWFDIIPDTDQTVSLTGLTDDADLLPILPSMCTQGHTDLPDTNPEDCQLTTVPYRVIFAVNGLESSEYILSIAQTPSVDLPVNEGGIADPIGIRDNIPTEGQVGSRGTSFYTSTDLTYGNYTVSISGLSDDADLGVYTDGTYSFELDCSLTESGDVLDYPEDCIVENVNALYFSVKSGELNRDGASYIILVR
jgi:hypothetical protein